MIPIEYRIGDATRPEGTGFIVIAHCVNNLGIWGAGFVLALSRRWPVAQRAYTNMPAHERVLGSVQFIKAEKCIVVANIVGQHGVGFSGLGQPPIRYPALKKGFAEIRRFLEGIPSSSVHMPRIGCGLAGGVWDRVEPLIGEELSNYFIPVVVYDLQRKESL